MEVLHDFLQVVLGLVLSSHIGEFDALGGLDIDLGVGFSKHHGIGPAHLIHHLSGQELADGNEDGQRQDPGQN